MDGGQPTSSISDPGLAALVMLLRFQGVGIDPEQIRHQLLDLADIALGSNTTLGYVANSNNTGGTLTVSDGTHTANIALLGQYMAASFVMATDGSGGTLIHDPPATLAQTLTQPQHA